MIACPAVPLRDVARQIARGERPDPEQRYRIVGVRLWGGGAYERESILGSETQYPQLFRFEEGDIVVNKIWARNGSVSVIGRELAGTFGSPEFPAYTLDRTRVDPAWARWFTRHPSLWRQCETLSRGTSGQNRLKPERFLDVTIPLPPLAEQRRMVAKLDAAAGVVARRCQGADAVELQIAGMLASAFRDITADAPRVAMGEIAPLVRRPVNVDPDGTYPELGVRSFGKGTFHKPALAGNEVGSKKLFRIQGGDLLFNIVFAWEGAVAVAQPHDSGRVGSHRFLTCVPDPSRATSDFLRFWFQTQEGLQSLGRASPGGAGRNRTLGIKALETIAVPVPSLDAQLWFDELQTKARLARDAQAAAGQDLDKLIPAMLEKAFGI